MAWFAAFATMLVAMAIAPAAASAQSDVDDPMLLEAGEMVFAESCAGCHATDGTGTDFGRPLTGIAGQQPDRLVHIESVTMGKGDMPAFGTNLSAEEIDSAVAYARITFVSDQDMEALPTTGIAAELFLAAAALIGVGLSLNVTARRRGQPIHG